MAKAFTLHDTFGSKYTVVGSNILNVADATGETIVKFVVGPSLTVTETRPAVEALINAP